MVFPSLAASCCPIAEKLIHWISFWPGSYAENPLIPAIEISEAVSLAAFKSSNPDSWDLAIVLPRLRHGSGAVAEWSKAAVLKTAGPVMVPWVRIPPAPPLAHCKPENRSLAGPFSLCAKGVCKDHPPFGDWPAARDRSPNAHRLFPPAPRSRRDGFKTPIYFNELTGSRCARVSLVPACFKADGATTRAAWSLVCLGSFARSL